MKTLKHSFLALCLVLTYGVTSASQLTYRLSMPMAVNAYIDAVAYGKTDNLEEAIDNRAVFTMISSRGSKNYDKKAIINMIKANHSIQQNCETSYKVLENDDKRANIKVFYKYDTFTRIDNVTMTGSKNGWKITKVMSNFV